MRSGFSPWIIPTRWTSSWTNGSCRRVPSRCACTRRCAPGPRVRRWTAEAWTCCRPCAPTTIVYVANLVPVEYQGIVESHDLVMDLGDDAGDSGTTALPARLDLSDRRQHQRRALAADARRRRSCRCSRCATPAARGGRPPTSDSRRARTRPSSWISPASSRRSDHHVRIRTNMQIYWDQAFVATDDAEASPAKVTTLPLLSADLHFRGTSRDLPQGRSLRTALVRLRQRHHGRPSGARSPARSPGSATCCAAARETRRYVHRDGARRRDHARSSTPPPRRRRPRDGRATSCSTPTAGSRTPT